MGIILVIFAIIALYFVYLLFYFLTKKNNKKVEQKPVSKKQYKLPNRNLNYDFSISKLSRKNDCLNISVLLHNFTDKPITADLISAYYISAQTRTQYKGDCTRFVYKRLDSSNVDLDNIILPTFNIKREISVFKYDLDHVNKNDILILECRFNGDDIVLKNEIY